MNRLGLGQAAHVYDYSADPRLLLGKLADPIRELRTEGTPLVHVRRGWLHGTHLVVSVRPLVQVPVSLATFAATAGHTASQLAAEPPSEQDYLARAGQLARWEGISEPLLPLRPQGFTAVGTAEAPDQWSDELLDARDQLAGRLLEPLLGSAGLPSPVLLPHAARILALCALAHPFGIGIGTLPLRSHTEGIWSATGGTTDLRTAFSERFDQDRAVFLAALSGLAAADTADGEAALLHSWNDALHAGWGTATALAASGSVDEGRLAVAALRKAPLENGIPSPFHRAARLAGLNEHEPPYWHIAHRLLLNVLYSALSCLGITPVQRYYLCFGVSSAADLILGEDWSQRLERISRLRGTPATSA
ncbi:hypothetical protein [Streptacidiphilus sp. EB129]|uniref:hypothetical protein n=1 Tax=Streptacidiphilus sp. EB129 TaxID=3156262 RepID=UPI003516CC82